MQVCPGCGEENPDRFRLCGLCGTKLAPESPPQEVRKTVTIVFSDLKGSTSLGEKLDTESLREVLNVYFTEMKRVLESHGGTVEKYIGDAIMAVFGLPRVHEDDALRAVRAATDMQLALAGINDRLEAGWGVRLENRTGVNTGEVVAGDVTSSQRLVTGDAVNTAARLEQAAPALEVLISQSTYRLVKDAVEVDPVQPLELKGKAEKIPAFRLVSVNGGEGVARRLDAPMVGRIGELEILRATLGRSKVGRGPELITVLGPAGVGKSRLLQEFIRESGDEVIALRGRCLSYGDGGTFWPLAEVVRGAAGIREEDSLERALAKITSLIGRGGEHISDRIAAAIGLSAEQFPVQETFWATAQFLEKLAVRKPVIVVIEDVHWAEKTFLELIRHVIDSLRSAVVIVCTARRELLDDHPEWAEETENIRSMNLELLSEEESSLIVENLLGTSAFPAPVRARIMEASEGNPLFIEQMLSMLVDDGILQRNEDGEWILTSDLGSFSIPPSISALLTARLDRLGGTERAVIEHGSIIGQVFWRGAVEELAPKEIREAIGTSLVTLGTKELIRRQESTLAGQDTYRFGHQLIKDAAYHGLLKRTRADLHERFVDWLELVVPDRMMEYDEIRGHHLEQAYIVLVQLGPVDEHGRELGRRGAQYLSSAGKRALVRGDLPAAASLLRRAAGMLPITNPTRHRLLLVAGEALIEQGEFMMADAVLLEAEQEAAAHLDPGLELTIQVARLRLRYTTESGASRDEVVKEVQRIIPILEDAGEHEGLSRAWKFLTHVHWTASRYGEAKESAERVVHHAQQAGNSLMETRFLPAFAMCALYGPTPVTEALVLCQQLHTKAAGDRRTEGLLLYALSHLEAMQGQFDRARDLYRKSRAILEEFGWNFHASLTSITSGQVEMLAGDPRAAEAELRHDFEKLEQMGERDYLPTIAAYLSEALYRQGRFDEALKFTRISEEHAAADDVSSQFLWPCVRGKILARTGLPLEGEALVRQGLSVIRGADEPDSQAAALMDLAEVLRLAGQSSEALLALKEAADLFDRKGNVVSSLRAVALQDQIHAAP